MKLWLTKIHRSGIKLSKWYKLCASYLWSTYPPSAQAPVGAVGPEAQSHLPPRPEYGAGAIAVVRLVGIALVPYPVPTAWPLQRTMRKSAKLPVVQVVVI